jgi:hypothetical protein
MGSGHKRAKVHVLLRLSRLVGWDEMGSLCWDAVRPGGCVLHATKYVSGVWGVWWCLVVPCGLRWCDVWCGGMVWGVVVRWRDGLLVCDVVVRCGMWWYGVA